MKIITCLQLVTNLFSPISAAFRRAGNNDVIFSQLNFFRCQQRAVCQPLTERRTFISKFNFIKSSEKVYFDTKFLSLLRELSKNN